MTGRSDDAADFEAWLSAGLDEVLAGADASAVLPLLVTQFRELGRWNRTHNLTRVTDPKAAARVHTLDSVSGLLSLQRHLVDAGRWSELREALDAGSGGGFPGLPLAALAETGLLGFGQLQKIELVDAVRKKVSFLHHAAAEMGCSRAVAVHARFDALVRRERTLFVSRATIPLVEVARIDELREALGPGSVLALWVRADDASWPAGLEDAARGARLHYDVPELGTGAIQLIEPAPPTQ